MHPPVLDASHSTDTNMHLLAGFALLPVVLASVLTSYNAANGDQTSKLGLENLTGWNRQEWPDGKADNSSLFFTTGKDPKGVPAAHVHRSPHFVRAEYHSLNKQTLQDMTYFIGYHVSFESVDVSTKVFQWYVGGSTEKCVRNFTAFFQERV